MRIPGFLNATYSNDLKLTAFVAQALGQIEAHINGNRPVFFPEYTDHSIKHVELTLQTAIDLASPAARGLLTSVDAAALMVGVSLHDLGMYLTRDGFESLLSSDSHWLGVPFFDRKTWKVLWEEFYAEATRFDGRKLRQLFGEHYRPARPLPPHGSAWEDFDYLLVGEFLRRHHPRLAHEIALYGLPARAGNSIEICPKATEDQVFLADIAGLVARSHGIDLRTCVDYLLFKYKNKIDPRGSHPIYLGALLRIADYFQIQASRAPTARTDVTTFQSGISEGEWTVHQSVKDINNTGGDPEAIVVIAEPKDVETFLKLRKWIIGLQRELDQTWAVLGEVYGLQFHTGLNLLGLKIRRIKSNIDDVAEFARTVQYVPAQLAFEAANADLLKLLIVPLYGDRPEIGIRELFQNAIDAVRELNDLAIKQPSLLDLDRYDQEADVTLRMKVDAENALTELVITDRGIGMTADIVRDYFLKAGASFRKSDAWRKDHEDAEGHSRVLRTGRFGVGALAAFLIGDRIEITTRHVLAKQDEALRFSASLDDEFIALDRVRAPIGTQIRVLIPKEMRSNTRWIAPSSTDKEIEYYSRIGHYFLKEPSLTRYRPDGTKIDVTKWLPQPDDEVLEDWRWCTARGFERLFWTYKHEYPGLACNGILIENRNSSNSWLHGFIIKPNISVFDREGSLPVNLERNGLQGPIPFKNELLSSISDDLLAHALVEAPSRCSSEWFAGRYEGFRCDPENWSPWLIGRDGFLLNEMGLVANFKPKTIVLALGGQRDLSPWAEQIQSKLGAHDLIVFLQPEAFDYSVPRVKGLLIEALGGYLRAPSWLIGSLRATYVPSRVIEMVGRLRPGKVVTRTLGRLEKIADQNGWKCVQHASDQSSDLHDQIISLTADKDHPVIFSVFNVEIDSETEESSLSRRWLEVAGTSLVPFDVISRRRLENHCSTKIGKVTEVRRRAKTKTKRQAVLSKEIVRQ
ncbi:ATP-binding protein [Bradyrhizobium sp. DASA03076]|uniref:HD domain-containing protein n=1 Tax=Bradyrhizobium sp. BLXBL-03 TaxID=3395916 RepID=UPI003F6E97C6